MKPTEGEKMWPAISGSRFLLLFMAIVLSIALRPFLEGSLGALTLSGVFFSLVLITCIYSVSETRGHFLFTLIIGLPSILVLWLGILWHAPSLQIIGAILLVIFWACTIMLIIFHLFRVKEVMADTILGAACTYFLIGFAWGSIFFVLESCSPGSFSFPRPRSIGFSDFFYYSFVTLATVGFGDITPVSNPARSLTILEAVLGQLFMTTMIAILVGTYLSRSRKDSYD